MNKLKKLLFIIFEFLFSIDKPKSKPKIKIIRIDIKLSVPDQTDTYLKLIKIIDSCTNIFQFISIYEMTRRFKKMYKLEYDDLMFTTLNKILEIKVDKIHQENNIDEIKKNYPLNHLK